MERIAISRIQDAYFIASTHLTLIGQIPRFASEGRVGYTLCLECIKEHVGTLEPEAWYTEPILTNRFASFTDLPEHDRDAVRTVLAQLQAPSVSDHDLTYKCSKCKELSEQFDDTCLALKLAVAALPGS